MSILKNNLEAKITKDIKKNKNLSEASNFPIDLFEVDLRQTFGKMIFLGLMRERIEEDDSGLFVGEVIERTYNVFLPEKNERISIKVSASEPAYEFANGTEITIEDVQLTEFATANDFGLGIRCSKIKPVGNVKQEQPKQEQPKQEEHKK